MTAYYVQPHQSQYQSGASARTRSSGCTWSSGANGVGATSGGRNKPTPDKILSLLPREQETSPATPGWSLVDLRKALSRYGMTFFVRSGEGWGAAVSAVLNGHYVVLQGDSDQFSNNTCSGAFDGDHAIGWHPKHKLVGGDRLWWINDPICPDGRWERETILRRYATKFYAGIAFGVFGQRVPPPPEPPDSSTGGDMATAIRSEARTIASDSVVRVRAGAKLYRDEGRTVVRTLDESTLLDDFGVFVGASGYRAVRLIKGHFDEDGDLEGGIALVRNSDVTGGPRPKTADELADTAGRFQ